MSREPRVPALKDGLALISGLVQRTTVFSKLGGRQEGQTKFTKVQAYFVKRSNTAAQCVNCPWYLDPEKCAIVSEEGSPDPGKISPAGVCGLYWTFGVRTRGYGVAYGRGAGDTGVLPQVVRKQLEQKRMSVDDPQDIPPELTS